MTLNYRSTKANILNRIPLIRSNQQYKSKKQKKKNKNKKQKQTQKEKTSGAVTDLMLDDNYAEIRNGSPGVKAWARKALHYVNDLSYELNREREK